jgi:hypothetical protein
MERIFDMQTKDQDKSIGNVSVRGEGRRRRRRRRRRGC